MERREERLAGLEHEAMPTEMPEVPGLFEFEEAGLQVRRELVMDAAENLVDLTRRDFESSLDAISSMISGEQKIIKLKTYLHKAVDLAELTGTEDDKPRIRVAFNQLSNEYGGGTLDKRMSDEVCLVSRFDGNQDKIRQMLQILKETFDASNIEPIEYVQRCAYAIEQLARCGGHAQSRRELTELDAIKASVPGLSSKESVGQEQTQDDADIAEARKRLDRTRLLLWQQALEHKHESPMLQDANNLFDKDEFRRLGFRLAYLGPEETAQAAANHLKDRYYRTADDFTAAEYRVEAFTETFNETALAEALRFIADSLLPNKDKAELLITLSIKGSDAFNRLSAEARQHFAGTAKHVMKGLETELSQDDLPRKKPLNQETLREEARKFTDLADEIPRRKLGSFISKVFIGRNGRHEINEEEYLNAAQHAYAQLQLEVAFVTGNPEEVELADRAYDLYGSPKSKDDSDGHARNLAFLLRKVEILAHQGKVWQAVTTGQAEILAQTFEQAEEFYLPIAAGKLLRRDETEEASRLLDRLVSHQVAAKTGADLSTKNHTLLANVVANAETAYHRPF